MLYINLKCITVIDYMVPVVGLEPTRHYDNGF